MIKHSKDTRIGDDEIDLSGFIKEIGQHRLLFAGMLAAGIIVALLYIRFTLPVYEASTSILIRETNKPSMNMEDFLAGDLFGDQANIATERGVLASRSVMKEAIRQLSLQVSYMNTSVVPNRPLYKKLPFIVKVDSVPEGFPMLYDVPFSISLLGNNKFSLNVEAEDDINGDYNFSGDFNFGDHIVTPRISLTLLAPPQPFDSESNSFEFTIHSVESQVTDYLSRMKIDAPDKDATIVKVSFQDQIPIRAIDVLNTLTKVYIDLDIQDKTSVASLTLKFVDEQLDHTTKVVDDIEGQLQSFKEKNKTVNLSDESRAVLEKLNAIDVDVMKSEIELRSIDNLLSYIESNADMTQLAPSAMGLPDPLLVELISKYQELQARRNTLSYGVKNITPAIKVIDQEITETRQSLIENIKSIRQNVEATHQALKEQLAGYEHKIGKVPEIERELLSIQRQFEVNQGIYIYLLQKKAETSIAKAAAISDTKVLDAASMLDEPVAPNKKVIVGFSAFFALMLPLLFIFVRKFFKTTIGSRDELQKLTEIPVLGVVGHVAKTDNLIVQHRPKSRIAESFRSVRTNLQFFGSKSGNKVLLITSSVGGEGKSFVSINLGCVFAMQNHKVVIVGLDLRKPKLFQDFDITNETGVSSYLIGNAGLDDVIQHTNVANLDLIPSGPIPPNPGELVSKKELTDMIGELSKRYDYVLIDTPPLGIVSDAFVLMNLSHINVYVVRENFTRKEYIYQLNLLAEEGKLNNLAILLNDSDFGQSYGYSYGKGYGNGYGYYDDDYKSKGRLNGLLSKKKTSEA
ncbi:MAG TPA: polysaccharide biosynthesis tyrosine autokinase [Bacteroidia bacterium]|nr:polysaccharide biosynthesis tyrosine autokinase [Bacteroidia bacterium]